MSGSSIFHTEWYTDPPWDDLVYQWLTRYVNIVRNNPRLAAELPNVEMVPMPRALVSHVAGRKDPTHSAIERATEFEVGRSAPELVASVRNFARAVEHGDIDAALKQLSPTATAAHVATIKERLTGLFGAGKDLRIVPLKSENVAVVGHTLVGRAQFAFEGNFGGHYQSGTVELDFVFEKGPDGKWAISDVRPVS